MFGASDVASILKVFRLVRIIRMVKLLTLLAGFSRILKSPRLKMFVRLFKFLFAMLICVHFGACGWYAVGNYCYLHDGIYHNNWITANEVEESSTWEKYSFSMYWSVGTLMTTGYGDIIATNILEQWICIIFILIKFCLVAYLLMEGYRGIEARAERNKKVIVSTITAMDKTNRPRESPKEHFQRRDAGLMVGLGHNRTEAPTIRNVKLGESNDHDGGINTTDIRMDNNTNDYRDIQVVAIPNIATHDVHDVSYVSSTPTSTTCTVDTNTFVQPSISGASSVATVVETTKQVVEKTNTNSLFINQSKYVEYVQWYETVFNITFRKDVRQQRDLMDHDGLNTNKKQMIGSWCIDGNNKDALLGKGAFSTVYKAVDYNFIDNNKDHCVFVAIKLIEKDSNEHPSTWLANNEIQCLDKIQHENVIKMLGYDRSTTYNSVPMIAFILEYGKNGELRHLVQKLGALSDVLTRTYFHQILSGINACHKVGVIHRDMKLENIVLDAQYNAKICDFGLATVKLKLFCLNLLHFNASNFKNR